MKTRNLNLKQIEQIMKEYNKNFWSYGEKERESLSILFKDTPYKLEFTDVKGFDVYDAILTTPKGKKFIIEVKHKTADFDTVINRYSGLIIEQYKYNKLMEMSQTLGMPVYYINFCSCGVVITNEICDKNITEWKYNYSPRLTAVASETIIKKQGFIDIKKIDKVWLQLMPTYDLSKYPEGIKSVNQMFNKAKNKGT